MEQGALTDLIRLASDGDKTALQQVFDTAYQELRKLAGEGPILTDDQPRVEYFLSLPADDKAMDLSGLKGHHDEIVRP